MAIDTKIAISKVYYNNISCPIKDVALEQANATLQNSLNQKQQELATTQSNLNTVTAELTSANTSITNLIAEKAQLEDDKSALQAEIDSLESQLENNFDITDPNNIYNGEEV